MMCCNGVLINFKQTLHVQGNKCNEIIMRRVNRRTDRRILKIFFPGFRIQSEILTDFRILDNLVPRVLSYRSVLPVPMERARETETLVGSGHVAPEQN